jgi:hypothetical protein
MNTRRTAAPPPAPGDEAARQCFRLEIHPAAPGRPWSAALVSCPGGVRVEFGTPLALLRFLTRATDSPGGGLR